jgi:hypothetical protein
MWGQFFGAPLDYLKLFTQQSTTGPREVPELEVRERPLSTLRNTLTVGPREVPELEVRKLETWMAGPWGVLAVGLAAATTKVEDVDGGPSWGLLPACSAVATTEVGDVDGGPPRGCCR